MGVKNILLVESDGLLRDTLVELLSVQEDLLLTPSETGETALTKALQKMTFFDTQMSLFKQKCHFWPQKRRLRPAHDQKTY